MDDTNFQSTKFFLAVLLVLIGAVMMFVGKITFDQFGTLVTPIIGFYFAANVVGKVATAITSKIESTQNKIAE